MGRKHLRARCPCTAEVARYCGRPEPRNVLQQVSKKPASMRDAPYAAATDEEIARNAAALQHKSDEHFLVDQRCMRFSERRATRAPRSQLSSVVPMQPLVGAYEGVEGTAPRRCRRESAKSQT